MPRDWVKPLRKAPEQSGALLRHAAGDAPLAELHLWPYRSLPRRGFAGFIGLTAALLSLPLLVSLGSPVLWGLLPFLVLAVAGLWWALSRSYRDGEVIEVLKLWPDRVELVRQDPGRTPREWAANPHWVRLMLHPKGGPVPQYLTLSGDGREVEIGAFLSEGERLALHGELREALAALR
ncbi:MAG: DUF2244 domain-containing protein [Gemmobacter sp.]